MRRGYSREQWLSWIREQQASSLTITAFCQANGVGENSFYRWRAKLKAEGEVFGESNPPAINGPANGPANTRLTNVSSTNNHTASSFVPLSVVESSRIEIDSPCGAVVRELSDDDGVRCVLDVLLDYSNGRINDDSDSGIETDAGGAAC